MVHLLWFWHCHNKMNAEVSTSWHVSRQHEEIVYPFWEKIKGNNMMNLIKISIPQAKDSKIDSSTTVIKTNGIIREQRDHESQ
jgi:hypothetical protein